LISLSSRVVTATLDTLRSCGAGSRECLLYWTAGDDRGDVARVVHPIHDSTWSSCEVDGAWATRFFLDLPDRAERTVAQVHTHPGPFVEHSATDDAHVLVPSTGFVSIVVPYFGLRDDHDGWGIWQLGSDGSWAAAPEVITWRTG